MLAAYVFALVLGGSFLLLSLLGDIFGSDAEIEFEGELELDFDADVDMDVGDADLEAEPSGASKIFSFRKVVYALFGFGAVGTLLTILDLGSTGLVAAVAALSGIAAGAIVHGVFGYLGRTESGAHPGDASYVGLTGSVTLPLAEGRPGNIAVRRGHRRVTLRALPHAAGPEADPTTWESVIIIEMEGGVARVAPLEDFEDDLRLEP